MTWTLIWPRQQGLVGGWQGAAHEHAGIAGRARGDGGRGSGMLSYVLGRGRFIKITIIQLARGRNWALRVGAAKGTLLVDPPPAASWVLCM